MITDIKTVLRYNGCVLQYVPIESITKELCEISCKSNRWALEWVPDKFITKELCGIACKNDEHILAYTPNEFRTEELYEMACRSRGCEIWYVPDHIKTNEFKGNLYRCNPSIAIHLGIEYIKRFIKEFNYNMSVTGILKRIHIP